MEQLLTDYYNISHQRLTKVEQNTFIDNEQYVYSITFIEEDERIYDEQAMLAAYCIQEGYVHVQNIIPNIYGSWITPYNDHPLLLSAGLLNPLSEQISDGRLLANFHLVNQAYPYEPNYVTSYGKWKDLWVEKLTYYEKELPKAIKNGPSAFLARAVDLIPYLIGISENAISYLQENESESQFTRFDQGTITFLRYQNQLRASFIPFTDLHYDHPTRDIAEYVRSMLIKDNEGTQKSIEFLIDYNDVFPISLFGWKLLYARLLFPIQFFDIFDQVNIGQNNDLTKLNYIIERQTNFEKNLKELFGEVKRIFNLNPMYMVQWL